ncbi:MAG TPA: alpha/beta fold hydrolase [Candidatus Acidoferrum sp.]|nr:alpha/beta fold hydrolase [Candidatus Acidoferrum sp.]
MINADHAHQVTGVPAKRVRITLLCFSGAGGSSPVFHDWIRRLPAWLDLKSVVLPGHPGRFREKPAEELVGLACALAEEFESVLDKPFALFGHSLGALLAFEVARIAQQRGRVPTHLFVSACAAPQLPRRIRFLHNLPDRELQQQLVQYSRVPANIVNTPELMQLVLPVFRADIRLGETYGYTDGPPLHCPITAYAGSYDPSVTYQELTPWSLQSTGPFNAHWLPGDHQYLNDHSQPVVADVCQQLLSIAT